MALADTSGSIETAARPVDQSPTATNAHDSNLGKRRHEEARGGPSPYRAVEPWLLLLLLLFKNTAKIFYVSVTRSAHKKDEIYCERQVCEINT
jgi:hypothetical protein